MAEVNLVSTLAMGFLLLVILVAITRVRNWHAAPSAAGGRPDVESAWDSPATWSAGFVVAALVLAGIVVAVLDESVPVIGGGTAETLFLVLLGVVLTAFIAGGAYASVRNRGLPSSMAAAIASVILGSLLLLAIVLNLLLGG